LKNRSFVILSYFLKGAIKANNLELLAFFYISIIFIVCYTLRSDKIKRKEITVGWWYEILSRWACGAPHTHQLKNSELPRNEKMSIFVTS
jgi:hypothetical protein